jgi:hypothetical protein
VKFYIDTDELSVLGFPMYELGTNKSFTLILEAEDDEYLAGAYVSIANSDQVGSVFGRISGSETYVEVPGVTDNSLYIGEVLEGTTKSLDILFNLSSGDIDDFGEAIIGICVIDGIPDPSRSDSILFSGEDGPELFSGLDDLLWV